MTKLSRLHVLPKDSPDANLVASDAQLYFATQQKPDKAILYRGDEKVAESKLKEDINE